MKEIVFTHWPERLAQASLVERQRKISTLQSGGIKELGDFSDYRRGKMRPHPPQRVDMHHRLVLFGRAAAGLPAGRQVGTTQPRSGSK